MLDLSCQYQVEKCQICEEKFSMTTNQLRRLLAMLNPSCDDEAYEFVLCELMKATVATERFELIVRPPRDKRSEQQSVDPFESGLANDPRFW